MPAPATDRFEIRREIGAGAFGVVYEAFDRERGESVALKALASVDPGSIYDLKQEFRSLAGVVHPNLVALHELFREGDRWFLTMELVRGGRDFREHVGGDRGDLLRAALRQLCEGVAALHRAGKLHRDLKPSNALVTPEGRLVLLDFGLAAELRPKAFERDAGPAEVVGTGPYMAPELGLGNPAGAATDWYAVGVMLYDALAGRLPFDGKDLIEVLAAKITRDPGPPSAVAGDGAAIPEDLEELCLDLLARDPADRPGADEILERVGGRVRGPGSAGDDGPISSAGIRALPLGGAGDGGDEAGGGAAGALAADAGPALVGRERERAALAGALAAVARHGRAVAVHVHGPSGMGKSALVERFLTDVAARDEAVCLAGRCYERESVPYKAVDGVVDALSRHLRGLEPAEVEALLPAPRSVGALLRLFPVLGRVDGVATVAATATDAARGDPEPRELRRRAFDGLRELLARLAARRPLIVAVDDLQWGDLDGAALLVHLLRPPDPPPLLAVLGWRAEEAAASPCVQRLREAAAAFVASGAAASAPEVREVAVGPLPLEEASAFAASLLAPGDRRFSETIAEEASGNPFFIEELSLYLREVPGGAHTLNVSLDEAIRARFVRLMPEARAALETVAVAGRPTPRAAVLAAAGVAPDAAARPLALVRAARFVRSRPAPAPGGEETLEPYHDRIRAAVVASLEPAALAARHRRVAEALEAAPGTCPETIAVHWRLAGDGARAAHHAVAAAEQAAAALAFDRAARLYRLALELRPAGEEAAASRLLARLGDALANGGRAAEAAEIYVSVARAGALAPAERLDLERRAAEQLLRAGRIDEGLEAIRAVLGELGLGLAPSPLRAVVSLLLRRALVRLRGLGFVERDAASVPAADLARIDACWSVAIGLGMVDTVRGADLQARHLLLALGAGEPYRVTRALAMEAAYSAAAGGRARARTGRVLEAAGALAARISHPHALGLVALVTGTAAFLEGRFAEALPACERAEEILAERCSGVAWEVGQARVFALQALFYRGELAELARRARGYIEDAETRGDRYGVASFKLGLAFVDLLATDDRERARRAVDESMRTWSRAGFHIQHMNELHTRAHLDLHAGDAGAAHARVLEAWPALRRSFLLEVEYIRLFFRLVRGRCAVAAATARGTGSDEKRRLLRDAERDARRIERAGAAWALPMAALLRAGLAAAHGDASAAAARLEAAESGFAAGGMDLYAHLARRLRGARAGDAALAADADRWLVRHGVKTPERLAAILAPGL